MVPLRFLGVALGATLVWDAAERKVTYTLGDRTLVLWVDKTVAYLNGKPLQLDVPPTIVSSRTLLPLRFVSEQLGADVTFDGATRTATVVYPKGDAAPAPTPDPVTPTGSATTPKVAYAVYDNARLVKVDLTGDKAQTKFQTVFEPAGGIVQFRLSPSGKLVAYGDKAGRLVIRNLTAGTDKVLFTPSGQASGMENAASWHWRRNAAMPYTWAPGSDSAVFFLYWPTGDDAPTLMMANVDTNQVYKVKTSIYDVAITAQGKLLMNEGNQFAYYSTDTLDIDTKLTYDGTHTDRTTGEWYSRSMEASTSADGRYVAFVGTDPEEHGYGLAALYLLDVKDGSVRRIANSLDRCWANEAATDLVAPAGGRLTWSPDSRWVYGIVSDAGQVHLVKVDVASDAIVAVTAGDKVIHSFDLTADCSRAALAYATPVSPADVYLAHLDEACPTAPVANCCAVLSGGGVREVRLSDHNAELFSQLDLPVPERFLFSAGEGQPLVDGWVMRPAGFEAGKKYPAVLEVHGGPMSMYGCGMFYEFQWMAAQGYAVVFSNPRGSQGYGREFCHCIMADWGNYDYKDCMAAIEAAVAKYDYIDGDRLGIAGGSYGGFMVNWVVTHTDRFKAGVSGRSVVNRWSAMGTSDTGFNRIGQFGTENWWEVKNMAPYLKQSPLVHASNVHTPLLLENQEGDLRCPPEQAEQFYAALKYQGKTAKFIRYPGEFHGMSRTGKPWHRLHRLNATSEWFDEYLKA
jgi:dipeptidyl aminopeptidase/acylaminoacyl peptidase